MHRRLLSTLALIAFPTTAMAQTPAAKEEPPGHAPLPAIPWQLSITIEAFKKNGQAAYLSAVLDLRDREREATSSDDRSLFLDMYITHLCLVGEYAEARKLNAELMALYGSPKRGVTLEDGYAPVDAVSYILKAAEGGGGRRIVMFNEEHRSSIQRAFMCRLLRPLREQGFTHLAVEALSDGQDTIVNAAGYPTINSGLYTRDPAFGDMLRLARSLGFTLVSYDGHEERKPGMSPTDSVNSREAIQAKNIFERTIGANPDARVVVFGGRHHISKSQPAEGWKPMGGVLKTLSGTDPLAVDLMVMVEGENGANEAPAYTAAAAKGWLDDDAIVLVNDKEEPLRGFYKDTLDILVFHPRTRLVEGRPHWMSMGGVRRPVRVEIDRGILTEPMLLQARVSGEAENAIPMDQIVLRPDQPVASLMLRPGSYQIHLIDRTGKEHFTQELKVE